MPPRERYSTHRIKPNLWRDDPNVIGFKLLNDYRDRTKASMRTLAAFIDSTHASVSYWLDKDRRPHPMFRMRMQEALEIPAPTWATEQEIRSAKLIIASHDHRHAVRLCSTGWGVWTRLSQEKVALITCKAYMVLGERPPIKVASEAMLKKDSVEAALRDGDAINRYLRQVKLAAINKLDDPTDTTRYIISASKKGNAELVRRGLRPDLTSKEESEFDGTFDFDE